MAGVIKELHNEKSHFDKHLKIITCKELIIQFYQNQDSATFLFKVTVKRAGLE